MKTIIILSHVGFDNTPYCSYVHSHAKALVEKGYNVIVLASLRWFPGVNIIRKNRKEYYKKYKGEKIIDGVKVIYFKCLSISNILRNSKLNINGLLYFWTIKSKIKNIIKKEEVLFIDAHTFKIEGYVASRIKRKYKIPATITCHGTSFNALYKTKNGKEQIKTICDNVDYVIGVSDRFKEKLNAINVNNAKTIYNGINYYENERIENDRNYNGIITIANLIKQKNVNLVIEAFANIYKNNKELSLTIIGDGKEKEALLDLCRKLGISKVVNFTGRIPNKEVYKLLRENNIFVLTSVIEGFGIAYAEAMYNGCITIGTKNEGIDGFIKDNINGYLINPTVEEITQKIEYIMMPDNIENCEIIRNKGIEDARLLTWDRNATEYINLL